MTGLEFLGRRCGLLVSESCTFNRASIKLIFLELDVRIGRNNIILSASLRLDFAIHVGGEYRLIQLVVHVVVMR